MSVGAIPITLGTIASYVAFYSAFDKQTKTLKVETVMDLFGQKGVDTTLVQWNKVISLAGLTTMSLSLAPSAETVCSDPKLLLDISSGLLGAHVAYSTYRYYGSPNIPYISTFPTVVKDFFSTSSKEIVAGKRKVALGFGTTGIVLADLLWLGYVEPTVAIASTALGAGLFHFFFMEQDYKGKLGVRPFGYLAFLAPTAAITALIAKLLPM